MLHYLQPQYLIQTLGLLGVIAIIFAESGLFFGFFLPGDSLLFTAGLFASQGYLSIVWLVIGAALAAIFGDSVGYLFGKKTGPKLFTRDDSFFFHKKHAQRAEEFYKSYGVQAIIFARFIPIVRTFAPIVAGVGGMKYKTFISFNVIGGIAWTALLALSGYFLGRVYPGTERYLNWIIIFIIVVSIFPLAIKWIRSRHTATPVA